MNSDIAICTHCDAKVDIKMAKRICSNCFGCTGCERYVCTECGREIVVKDVRKANLSERTGD